MALENLFGELALDATLLERNGGGKLAATATVVASGNTTLIPAPGIGNQIRFYWVSAITDPDASTSPLIIIKASGGTEYYRVYAIAHWEPFTLPDNEGLVMNLEHASSVAVTVHYVLL